MTVGRITTPDLPGEHTNHVGNHERRRSGGAVTSHRVRTPTTITPLLSVTQCCYSTHMEMDNPHTCDCPGGTDSLNIGNTMVGHNVTH